MKKLSRCLWVGLVAVSLLSLAGCGKKFENQIIGSWQATDIDTGHPYIMVYRKDGEGVMKTAIGDIEFKWEVTHAGKNMITRTSTVFGNKASTIREITIEGNNLSDHDTDGKEVIKFVRVADDTEVPKIDLDKEMEKSEKEYKEANRELTLDNLKNATEEDKKFIEMCQKVIEHLNKASEIFAKVRIRTANDIANDAQVEFDAAWNLQVNHFGTPARFNDVNSKLRSSLLEFKSGLNTFRSNEKMDELVEAAKLADEATELLRTQMIAINNGQ